MNTCYGVTPSISKKYFLPGGIAPSEWMRSVRAVRDTLVADYSTPSVNTMHRIVYCPPITVSPFLFAQSVSYYKRKLWHCDQLWPYIRISLLGMCLDRDWNAMGDIAKISPRVPFNCAQNAILSLLIIHVIPSRQIYVAFNNPSLILSVSCLNAGSFLWNYVHVANNASHTKNLQNNGCRCYSHLYKFQAWIQVTWVFR